MIISRGRGYIFVHIPKTGGTSLALALEGRAMKDDILIGDTPKAQKRKGRLKGVETKGRLWKHASLRDAEGLISTEEMQSLFVFTLVRNPWDRVLSYYSWLQGQNFDHPAVGLAQSLDFGAFVAHPQVLGAIRAQPYASYVVDPDGAECCNLYLRLEHLDDDLPRLEAALGVKLGPLPHTNRSERPKTYREAYDESTRRLIETAAAADIARFGYAF